MSWLRPRDLALVVPVAVLIAAGVATNQPGDFLLGWVALSVLLVVGGICLVLAIRWANGGKALAWMTVLAFGLRMATGTVFYLVLPLDGYPEPDDRAGYVFTDAHRRDDQAWDLAEGKASLFAAFDRTHFSDQYGGLLALSALTYRLLSADAHRPLLVLALAALTAALGVPFFWRATGRFWGASVAALASWLYCVYPESVLTGGAQMREPFLMSFIAVSLWGFAGWLDGRSRSSAVWIGLGLVGITLVSPAVALVLLLVLAVWLRLRGEHSRLPVYIWVGAAVLSVAAFLFLARSLGGQEAAGPGPVGIIAGWLRDAVAWVIYQLERGSGQVQNVFSKLFPATRFLFVVAYGVTQPLLPPAILEPTTVTWHAIGILRALGWYVVLPLLVYAPVAARRLPAGSDRRIWVWLTGFSWLWILFSAMRAGGDQWDNPRYRLIFFGVQAMVAAMAWLYWRASRDPWLPRVLGAEALCLLLFSQWYVARYYLIGIHLPIMVVIMLSVLGVIAILGGGAIWDRRIRGART